MNGETPQMNSQRQLPLRWETDGQAEAWSPVKTPEGRAEISRRSRALNQRQRTVLLLVDGRRTISQIRVVAEQVGAPDTCFDDLLDMGLVALPTPAVAPVAAAIAVAAVPSINEAPLDDATEAMTSADAPELPLFADPVAETVADAVAEPAVVAAPAVEPLPLAAAAPVVEHIEPAPTVQFETEDAYRPPTDAFASDPDSQPSGRLTSALFDELVLATPQHHHQHDAGPSTMDSTLRPNSRFDSMVSSLFPLLESAFGSVGRIPNADRPQDDALEEARRILMREVRSKAPVTGALTLAKLRRAATREEMTALFDEVGSHISLPMRRLSTQQILLHVRGLLERPM